MWLGRWGPWRGRFTSQTILTLPSQAMFWLRSLAGKRHLRSQGASGLKKSPESVRGDEISARHHGLAVERGEVGRLNQSARELLADPEQELYFSAASVWEIAIKAGLGRLELREPPRLLVPRETAGSDCGPCR